MIDATNRWAVHVSFVPVHSPFAMRHSLFTQRLR